MKWDNWEQDIAWAIIPLMLIGLGIWKLWELVKPIICGC